METKATDIILNSDNTSTWTFKEEGDISGTFSGTFIFKCFLNPLEQLSAGKLYRELLGSNLEFATDNDKFLAFTMSQLQKRIVKAPPFWSSAPDMLGNIPDSNILSLVLEKAIESESLYKARLAKKRADALEASKNLTESLLGASKGDIKAGSDPK